MKYARSLCLATLTAISLGVSSNWSAAEAATFDQAEVDQSRFVAIASPLAGGNLYRLAILEQVSDTRPCWQESGSRVDPLLLNFDFTNICARNPDSNGYSVRVGGQDLGLQYDLRIVRRSQGLSLMAVPIGDSRSPALEVGRAVGSPSGYTKITLNPGWRFTRRVFQGQALGHVYLTNDRSLNSLIASAGSRSSFDDRFDADSGTPSRRPIATRPTQRTPMTREDRLPSSRADRLPSSRADRLSRNDRLPSSRTGRLPAIDRPVNIPVPAPNSRGNNSGFEFTADNGDDSYDTDGAVVRVPSRPVVGNPGSLPTPRSNNGNLLPVPALPPPPPGMPEVAIPGTRGGSGSWANNSTPTVPPAQLASQLGFSYRVVVQSSSPEVQNQVKALAPDAFRTIVDGQTVIQAGLFRQLEDAEAFQQNLSDQNLRAVVVPVNR